jgi:hypothetical protein
VAEINYIPAKFERVFIKPLEIRGAPLAHQLSWSRDELIIIDNFINKEI